MEEFAEDEILALSRVGTEESIKNVALQVCLTGIRFPATKKQLVKESKRYCTHEITNALNGSSKHNFNSITEVEETVL